MFVSLSVVLVVTRKLCRADDDTRVRPVLIIASLSSNPAFQVPQIDGIVMLRPIYKEPIELGKELRP
jgi:hypothetical protein